MTAPDARQMLDAAMSEAEFHWTVVECAQWCGWLAYHTWDSRRSAPGFPDLVLVHPGGTGRPGTILFVELKRHDGILSSNQERWRDAIRAAGGDHRVWRPQDWPEIEATLKGGT